MRKLKEYILRLISRNEINLDILFITAVTILISTGVNTYINTHYTLENYVKTQAFNNIVESFVDDCEYEVAAEDDVLQLTIKTNRYLMVTQKSIDDKAAALKKSIDPYIEEDFHVIVRKQTADKVYCGVEM